MCVTVFVFRSQKKQRAAWDMTRIRRVTQGKIPKNEQDRVSFILGLHQK